MRGEVVQKVEENLSNTRDELSGMAVSRVQPPLSSHPTTTHHSNSPINAQIRAPLLRYGENLALNFGETHMRSDPLWSSSGDPKGVEVEAGDVGDPPTHFEVIILENRLGLFQDLHRRRTWFVVFGCKTHNWWETLTR